MNILRRKLLAASLVLLFLAACASPATAPAPIPFQSTLPTAPLTSPGSAALSSVPGTALTPARTAPDSVNTSPPSTSSRLPSPTAEYPASQTPTPTRARKATYTPNPSRTPSPTPFPTAVVDWNAVNCSSLEWIPSSSDQGREIGLALQRGLSQHWLFQGFYPQIYDTTGRTWIYRVENWAVVNTGFQVLEGAIHVLASTGSGFTYLDYFVVQGSFAEGLSDEEAFSNLAHNWPDIPPEAIACLPWKFLGHWREGPTQTPTNLAALRVSDCSKVEWIDPQTEEGRLMSELLLSIHTQPAPLERIFNRIGPIQKVGEWVIYQAERSNFPTLYVLGPTSQGLQFFGEGWESVYGENQQDLEDIQRHLLERIPEAPIALAGCIRPEPWLFKRNE